VGSTPSTASRSRWSLAAAIAVTFVCGCGGADSSALAPAADASIDTIAPDAADASLPDGPGSSADARDASPEPFDAAVESPDADAGGPESEADAFDASELDAGATVVLGVSTERLGTLAGYGRPMPAAQADPYVRSAQAGGDTIFGLDLGMSTVHLAAAEPRTYFFFGDTWPLADDFEQTGNASWIGLLAQLGKHGVNNGDSVGYTTDPDPSDGIQLDHVLRNEEGAGLPVCPLVQDNAFRATWVSGVNLACRGNHVLPEDESDYKILTVEVPTGVVSVADPGSNQGTLFLWYSRLPPSLENATRARSYVAASIDDGLSWKTLQQAQPLSPVPFSAPSGPSDSVPARFVNVSPVLVNAEGYQGPESAPCHLPLPAGADKRGVLLFASGLYRKSDVYLAFVPVESLRSAAADPSSAIGNVAYFAGTGGSGCWSSKQDDAVALLRSSDPELFSRYEAPCGNRVFRGTSGAGELSVKRVTVPLAGGGSFDRLVALVNLVYGVCVAEPGKSACCGAAEVPGTSLCEGPPALADASRYRAGSLGVALVAADPRRPWAWTSVVHQAHPKIDLAGVSFAPAFLPPAPQDDVAGLGTACGSPLPASGGDLYGYGPYMIEGYAHVSPDGTGASVYFTLSRWKGKLTAQELAAGPYRVDVFRTLLRESH
jgi:hypothetical protein